MEALPLALTPESTATGKECTLSAGFANRTLTTGIAFRAFQFDITQVDDDVVSSSGVQEPAETSTKRRCLTQWLHKHTAHRALMTDLISRVLFPATFIAFNAFYWTYYYLESKISDELWDLFIQACVYWVYVQYVLTVVVRIEWTTYRQLSADVDSAFRTHAHVI